MCKDCITQVTKSLFELYVWHALRDLVPFVQLKKREKHPWKSVAFSKAAGWS